MFCSSCLCISNDRDVYSFGKSNSGLHGQQEEFVFPPEKIKGLKNIKMIDCGGNHTVCIDYNGKCYSFGSNEFGQLGINKSKKALTNTFIPQVIDLPFITYISCGFNFTACLSEDFIVYTFGCNKYGQLGIGKTGGNYVFPNKVQSLQNIEYISCGGYHCISKTFDSCYYSWGTNCYGQLGYEDTSCNEPTKRINWPKDIIDIKCGTNHSIILLSEGQVYGFGYHKFGRLGLGKNEAERIYIPTLIKDLPPIRRIECGYTHNVCIDFDNNIWGFGFNGAGNLGVGDNIHRFTPIKNEFFKDVFDISSSGDNIFVKTINNEIYACGTNKNSHLGINIDKVLLPMRIFEGNEDIWCSTIGKSKQKSARK